MSEKRKAEDRNAKYREKYKEQWHDFNLRSCRFGEDVNYNFSKLPKLKQERCFVGSKRVVGSDGDADADVTTPNVRTSGPNNANAIPSMMISDIMQDDYSAGSSREGAQYVHGESQVLNSREVYLQLLLEMDSISPCNEQFTKFVLNEFDLESNMIKVDKYVMITRRSICFKGIWKWAYFCSCDPGRSQVLRSASVHIQESIEDMLRDLPGCLHIDCLRSVLVDFDKNVGIRADHQSQDHNYSSGLAEDLATPPHFDDIWPVAGNPQASIIITDQSFVVINIVGNDLKCLSCWRVHCQHTTKLKSVLEEDTDLPVFLINMAASLLSTSKRRIRIGSAISWKKIPFKLTSVLSQTICKPVKDRVYNENGILQLIPPQEGRCESCQALWSEDTLLKGQFPVFTLQSILTASVFYRKCSNVMCDCELHYDGLSNCLLNMNTYLIDHCIMRQYMYQLLYGRSLMNGFYNVWAQMQIDAGNCSFPELLHYNKFVWGWYSFLHLLDINYQEQFICGASTCGSNPEIIICDATHISLRKDLSAWKQNIQKTDQSTLRSSASVYRKSVFITDSDTRKLLKKYSKSSKSHPFSSDDFLTLIDGCKEHQASIVPILHHLSNEGDTSAPPNVYQPLLQALSSTSPVCGLVCPEDDLLELLHKMTLGYSLQRDLKAMIVLTDKCPLIANLLEHQETLPVVLFPIFNELVRLSKAPFKLSAAGSYSSATHQASLPSDNPSNDFDGMVFWPHLPQQRMRDSYTMDNEKSNKSSCRKDTKNYGRMTPGIFAAFCPHGICYGFEIMNQFESPNVPFTLFLTRFATPPKVIIYDNACHLHTYCLNREPQIFKNTKFLIDRLQWPNHTACSCGYKLDDYLQYKNINSQAAEQMNSSLQRIKIQLSYMTLDNFLWHCRFFLWGRNLKKLGGNLFV